MGELQVAEVRAQVGLSPFMDFENFSLFKPSPHHEKSVNHMLDQFRRVPKTARPGAHSSNDVFGRQPTFSRIMPPAIDHNYHRDERNRIEKKTAQGLKRQH